MQRPHLISREIVIGTVVTVIGGLALAAVTWLVEVPFKKPEPSPAAAPPAAAPATNGSAHKASAADDPKMPKREDVEQAVFYGKDRETVIAAINAGLDPNLIVSTKTILGWAAHHGDTVLTDHLLKKGANVNRGEPLTGKTPLMLAAAERDIDAVKFLLASGADVTAQTYSSNAILEAKAAGAPQIVELLAEAGAWQWKTDRDSAVLDAEQPFYIDGQERTFTLTARCDYDNAPELVLTSWHRANPQVRYSLDGSPFIAATWVRSSETDELLIPRPTEFATRFGRELVLELQIGAKPTLSTTFVVRGFRKAMERVSGECRW
jgi:hypothetical protein